MDHSSCNSKPVIAVDVDEVLADLMGSLVNFHNDTYGSTLVCADFHSYEFHLVWGGTKEECQTKVDAFFQSEYFEFHISPVEGALDSLLKLKEHFQLHIVTSRTLKLELATRKWIERYYPDLFESIQFGNHYSTEGKVRSKIEMCKEINACMLIDDSAKYACECAAAKMPVILFGDYAWNTEDILSSFSRDLQAKTNSNSEGSAIVSDTGGYQISSNYIAAGDIDHSFISRVSDWKEVVPLVHKLFQVKNTE